MLPSELRNIHARRVFDAIAGRYEGPAELFSLFQYGSWRRFLVSRLLLTPQDKALDVCTGTGLVAAEMRGRFGCQVVGVDLSEGMLEQARRNLRGSGRPIRLVAGRAETLPFADESFDAVVFTYLLRYVDDPQGVLQELARVLRPGGQMASLEFFIPPNPVLRSMWLLHTRLLIPVGTRFLSPGWREVGGFLGPSISAFYRRYSLEDLMQMWRRVGVNNVSARVLSLGGAVVMWGEKEANDEE